MENNEPRWTPSVDLIGSPSATFLGYANDLDVWFEHEKKRIDVVGPKSRVLPNGGFNFDSFLLEYGVLAPLDRNGDIHIDVHDMCLIYALCVEKGVLNGEE
jgi:hypothetical protein